MHLSEPRHVVVLLVYPFPTVLSFVFITIALLFYLLLLLLSLSIYLSIYLEVKKEIKREGREEEGKGGKRRRWEGRWARNMDEGGTFPLSFPSERYWKF